jgi:hypothetical protein
MVGSGGFEPPKSKTADLQSDPFGRSGNSPFLLFISQTVCLRDCKGNLFFEKVKQKPKNNLK